MDIEQIYVPKFAKIEKITKETEDSATFKINYPCDNYPGQFLEISILGHGECPISICSNSDSFVELCIRDVGTVTKAISELKKGDKIGVRGPFGKGYPMAEFEKKNIIVIGGGTGVAPLRGVIKYIENNRKNFGNVSLFFGFRNPEEILFNYEIDRWKKDYDFNITVDKAESKWKGNTGVITSIIDRSNIDKENSIAILCGPPIMIKFVVESLYKKGFKDHQIWVSLERRMKCGVGRCGHCQVSGKYVCKDGPVFNYAEAKNMID